MIWSPNPLTQSKRVRAAGTILRPAFFMGMAPAPTYPARSAEPILYHIALGSNLGNRLAHLQGAIDELDTEPGCRVVGISSVWETEAHVKPGAPAQPDYLNALMVCRSALAPELMLRMLLHIEAHHGRDRSAKGLWLPRPLDLDIVLAGPLVVDTDQLTLPHPRLADRRFVLAPLAEIASDVQVPAPFHESVGYLLDMCPDTSDIRRTSHSLQLPRSA